VGRYTHPVSSIYVLCVCTIESDPATLPNFKNLILNFSSKGGGGEGEGGGRADDKRKLIKFIKLAKLN